MKNLFYKKMKFILIFILSILLIDAQLFAGNPAKRGQAGATQLLLPVGGRGSSLSGSGISIVKGIDAIHWNPAGLAGGVSGTNAEAFFSNTDYLGDLGVSYFGVGFNSGDIGTIGLTLKSISFGEIPVTTTDFPDGTGSTYSPNYYTLGITYSKSLTDRISVGVTGKYISEKIVRTSANGFAIDAGVNYNVTQEGTFKGLSFGVVLKNIGPEMTYNGSDLEETITPPNATEKDAQPMPVRYISQSFELPATFELGVAYNSNIISDMDLTICAAFQNSNFGNDIFRYGVEIDYANFVSGRFGYSMQDGKSQKTLSTGDKIDDYIYGFTMGMGINYELGGGTAVGIDYSYSSTKIFSGGIQTIGINVFF
ncbi:MAG: PorV/PorQ family protein [Bacteroidetes bacterium]|nr:PorV/PorQ family protein [Bacteroidota bacterium]